METNKTDLFVPALGPVCENRAPRGIARTDTGEVLGTMPAAYSVTPERAPRRQATPRDRTRRKVSRKQARASRRANR